MDCYDIDALVRECIEDDTPESRAALGEWCDRYGHQLWDGESYDVSLHDEPSGTRQLYPIYTCDDDHDANRRLIGWAWDPCPYNVVAYDGGYRLLERYCDDGYIINGEDITRIHFSERAQAERVLRYLVDHGHADGYDGMMERVMWQERAIADWYDHEPIARCNHIIADDSEPENEWLDHLHLSTAVRYAEEDPDYEWLRDVYGGDNDDVNFLWGLLYLCGMIDDYPPDYTPPQ